MGHGGRSLGSALGPHLCTVMQSSWVGAVAPGVLHTCRTVLPTCAVPHPPVTHSVPCGEAYRHDRTHADCCT